MIALGASLAVNITYGRPDPSGQPTIEQYAVTTSTGTAQAYVLSDPKTGQPLMLSTSSDQNGLYVMDAIGNPVGMLTSFASNAFTFNYDPYGAANLTAGGTGGGYTQNPYLFKAGIQDRATGLIKFGQRWYNPTTGAWTQQDTLDAPLDPANGNRYAYASGDPINGSDPSGLDSVSCDDISCTYEQDALNSVETDELALSAVVAGPPLICLGTEGIACGLVATAYGIAVGSSVPWDVSYGECNDYTYSLASGGSVSTGSC